MQRFLLYIYLLLLAFCSCNRQTPQHFDPSVLSEDLALIDSINRILIEEQPDYSPMVIDPATGLVVDDKEFIKSWDIVKKDWNKFVVLCNNQKYKKAAKLLSNGNFKIGVLGYLYQPELRYYFITNILDPILLDYANSTDKYLYQYLDWRRYEMALEMNLVNYGNDIPEHFTELLKQVGYGYAWNGDFDRALGMVDILDPVIFEIERDSLTVMMNHCVYIGNLFLIDGDTMLHHNAINYFRDSILPEYEPIGSPRYRLICRELEDELK